VKEVIGVLKGEKRVPAVQFIAINIYNIWKTEKSISRESGSSAAALIDPSKSVTTNSSKHVNRRC
jgi:hypothetical protein